MDSGWAAIIGAGVGGLAVFLSSFGIQIFQRANERRNLLSAFKGEISAILKIVKLRRYKESFKGALKKAKENAKNGAGPIKVRGIILEQNYFEVYERNTQKIGSLGDPLPEKICKFYTLAKSLIEDVTNFEKMKLSTWPAKTQAIILEEILKIFEEMEKQGREVLDFKPSWSWFWF